MTTQYTRKVKKTPTLLTLALLPNEDVSCVTSLQQDLLAILSEDSKYKLRVDASKTAAVDASFVQLWMAANKQATQMERPLEITGLNESVKGTFVNLGVYNVA